MQVFAGVDAVLKFWERRIFIAGQMATFLDPFTFVFSKSEKMKF